MDATAKTREANTNNHGQLRQANSDKKADQGDQSTRYQATNNHNSNNYNQIPAAGHFELQATSSGNWKESCSQQLLRQEAAREAQHDFVGLQELARW